MLSTRESGTSARKRAPAGPAAAGAEAAERLGKIIREASTPEDALEPALRAIVEATGGAGGAICFFDQRKEVLRLAAECNLSDEGCRRLRSVRRGDVAGWDMPLHGLLNRRAYLIDSAAKNRYVPPLVEPPAVVRSIVCLPLFQGGTALGSLLIVATGARVLMERDIRNLEPSLRELSALIEAIRLRAPTLTPVSRPSAASPVQAGPTPPPPHAAEPGEVVMLRGRLEELEARVGDERARADELAGKLEEATAALSAVRSERDELRQRLAEFEARAEAQARRAAELEARLAAAPAPDTASESLRAQLAALKAEVAEKQQAIERLEPAAHASESLERDLRAVREREMALRATVASLEAEVARLRAAASGSATQTSPAVAPADAAPRPQAPPAPAPATPQAPARKKGGSGIVVIDTGDVWGRLGPSGSVKVMAPDEQLGARLEQMAAERMIVNLTAPGALHALARLRASGSALRFWACLALGDGARVLPLGMVEPVVLPVAPDALAGSLEGYAVRGTRVVTLGRDVEAFAGFRQSIAQQGLSVSMAWDAKQATDLITMVRPEIAIVDLESLREGCTLVATMAGTDPLPHLILLLGAKDPAQGFALALRDPAHKSRALPLERLMGQITKRAEARPPGRP